MSTNFVLAKKWKKWVNLFTFLLKLIFKEILKSGKNFSLIFLLKDIESIAFSQNLSILKKFVILMHLFWVGGSTIFYFEIQVVANSQYFDLISPNPQRHLSSKKRLQSSDPILGPNCFVQSRVETYISLQKKCIKQVK